LRTKTPKLRPSGRLKGGLGLAAIAALALPASAAAQGSGGVGSTGSGETTTTPGSKAKLVKGRAVAPADAPARVVRAIEAANEIIDKPYRYGGGHARWKDRGYDCSGTASYALGKYGARLLKQPMASGEFRRWGQRGRGSWITAYSNPGHMFLVIAGLRLDTSMVQGDGPGWSSDVKAGKINGPYKVRHKGKL
jgi:hypothetical protein